MVVEPGCSRIAETVQGPSEESLIPSRSGELGIEFVAGATDEQVAKMEWGLEEHSAAFASSRAPVPVRAVYLDSGRMVAGLDGAEYWKKIHVRRLWVHPDYRSRGLGRRLMEWAEERGRELGCTSLVVDTMSFQAPGFYERLGYRRFGMSEGYEGGASRHYFEKGL